jgi:FMN reductase
MAQQPFIVGIGGSAGKGLVTEHALRQVLDAAEAQGARTQLFGGGFLASLPLYAPGADMRTPEEVELVEAIRACDGVVIASPGYHGGVSGLVKNALDLLEELRTDARPYLDGRAVGLVAVAAGWQATGSTLMVLRSIVHALRGWPTPFGAAVNSTSAVFDDGGRCAEPRTVEQLALVSRQVLQFAEAFSARR